MGFIRVILIILIIYYVIRIISRILTPILLNLLFKKMKNQQNQSYEKQREEGDVIIENVPKNKKSNDNVGEYVDFEEVDEK